MKSLKESVEEVRKNFKALGESIKKSLEKPCKAVVIAVCTPVLYVKDLYWHTVFYYYLRKFMSEGGIIEPQASGYFFFVSEKGLSVGHIFYDNFFNFHAKALIMKRILKEGRERKLKGLTL